MILSKWKPFPNPSASFNASIAIFPSSLVNPSFPDESPRRLLVHERACGTHRVLLFFSFFLFNLKQQCQELLVVSYLHFSLLPKLVKCRRAVLIVSRILSEPPFSLSARGLAVKSLCVSVKGRWGRPRRITLPNFGNVQQFLITFYSFFIKACTWIWIFSKVTHQLPPFWHRVSMYIIQLLFYILSVSAYCRLFWLGV